MAKRWTPEEDELLLKLRSEGFTAKEMTVHLRDRTYAAIRTRIAAIAPDNKNRPWTEEEKELVFQMKAEGKSNKQIARAIDRTLGAVASFVFRHWNGSSPPDLGG
jgi:DNA-binding NarL/FixJ family response regulator